MLFLFLLCVLAVWMFWAYHTVVNKRNAAFDAFEQVDIELKKRYTLIMSIISLAKSSMIIDQSLVNSILKLQDEVVELGLKPEFIDRRIALDTELEKKSEELIAQVSKSPALASNPSLETSIKEYSSASDEISLAKQDYNYYAQALRKAVFVFPTSFMARLNNIKHLNYMK